MPKPTEPRAVPGYFIPSQAAPAKPSGLPLMLKAAIAGLLLLALFLIGAANGGQSDVPQQRTTTTQTGK
ncbi:hypothetical protein ACWFR5_25925 [Streptomyces sp. NPDC055092]